MSGSQDGWGYEYSTTNIIKSDAMNWMKEISSGRNGTTTHGKRKAVKYIIKVL
jgi:hypothetical protein